MCLPLDAAGEFSRSTCDLLLLESQARNEYRVRTVLTGGQRREPYVLGAGVAIVGAHPVQGNQGPFQEGLDEAAKLVKAQAGMIWRGKTNVGVGTASMLARALRTTPAGMFAERDQDR